MKLLLNSHEILLKSEFLDKAKNPFDVTFNTPKKDPAQQIKKDTKKAVKKPVKEAP